MVMVTMMMMMMTVTIHRIVVLLLFHGHPFFFRAQVWTKRKLNEWNLVQLIY